MQADNLEQRPQDRHSCQTAEDAYREDGGHPYGTVPFDRLHHETKQLRIIVASWRSHVSTASCQPQWMHTLEEISAG